jgi:predicted dehydrogenase
MCNGLIEAGATLKWVYDPDPAKVDKFVQQYPQVLVAASLDVILNDSEVHLVAGAAIPSERCALGLKTMAAGKDYFTDKAPLTTLEQLADAKAMVEKTGKKYAVYYSERLHVESAVFAGQLVQQGAIGRVCTPSAPARTGKGRQARLVLRSSLLRRHLCDIGSHQIEQFLFYTGNSNATVIASQARNTSHPQYPAFEDFGDAMLKGENGASGYFRCDWFTPDGLSTWGDGRLTLLGPRGTLRSANMSI